LVYRSLTCGRHPLEVRELVGALGDAVIAYVAGLGVTAEGFAR